MTSTRWTLTALAILLVRCGSSSTVEDDGLSFDDFVNGKLDTGYIGDRAAELEAKLEGRIFVDMTTFSAAERERFLEGVKKDPSSQLGSEISNQTKYARNQLKANRFDLNLEKGSPVVTGTREVPEGLWVDYTIKVDSLIKMKDLEAKGLRPADLVGVSYNLVLPVNTKTIFAKAGIPCTSEDGLPLPPTEIPEVNETNYFYYFDPAASGCSLVEGVDVTTAHYAIESSLEAPLTYPEFDRLVADRLVTMVAFFGQIKHGTLAREDPGWAALSEWRLGLVRQGFVQVETFPDQTGEKWEKVHASGLRIVVANYSPEALSDHRDRNEVAALFKEEIAKNEIVYYAGHSFYGSLDVLKETDMYPKGTYQIFFMDSCWSYSYYTRQVFIGKASAEDPTGMVSADVINNTEPGMTSADPPGLRFFAPLFEGAAAVASGAQPTRHSWNKIVAYVNAAAVLRAKTLTNLYGGEYNAEIYGVSGARNNAYRPITADSQGMRYEQPERLAIVDNTPAGVTSTIEVQDSGSIASVFVDVDIEHPWNGDLVVKLSHVDPDGQGTREVVLFNRFGDTESDSDLRFEALELTEFNELDLRGTWKLSVADVGGGGDVGALRSWALRIVPRPE